MDKYKTQPHSIPYENKNRYSRFLENHKNPKNTFLYFIKEYFRLVDLN